MDKVPSVIFISIDSARPDVLLSRHGGWTPAPFIDELFESNFTLSSCYSTGYPTQFTLPALMSSTLPLDYGGYDYGIRDRPTALAEVFEERGYDTAAFVNGFMTSRLFFYDRGFQTYQNQHPLGKLAFKLPKIYLPYWKEKLKSDERDDSTVLDQAIPFIREYLSYLLEYTDLRRKEVEDEITHPSRLSPRLHEVDFEAATDRIEEALASFNEDPRRYTYELTMAHPDVPLVDELKDAEGWTGADLSLSLSERLRLRARILLGAAYPYITSYYGQHGFKRTASKVRSLQKEPFTNTNDSSAEYVFENLQMWARDSNEPLFGWAHLTDVHGSNYFSWELEECAQSDELSAHLEYLRSIGWTDSGYDSSPVYDLGLRLVDYHLNQFVTEIHETLDDPPLLVITADHGYQVLPLRSGDHVLNFYDEQLHVPVAFVHPSIEPGSYDGLCSAIDVAPTLLDVLGIDIPKGFDGVPIRELPPGGRDYIVAEDYQRGPVDPISKKPNICIRTEDQKVVCRPSESSDDVRVVSAFDLASDPDEQFPVDANDAAFGEIIDYARTRSEQIAESIARQQPKTDG